jgi:diguanylate cyclase (GGDEF)-like protein
MDTARDGDTGLDEESLLLGDDQLAFQSTPPSPGNVRIVHSPQVRAQQRARQAVRMRRILAICLFGLLYIGAVGIFFSQALVSETTFKAVVVVVSGAMGVFYFVFLTGLNQRAQEKSLTAPIVVCSLAILLWTFYQAPETRVIFAPFASVTIAFGMYRLAQKRMVVLSAATLIAYALVIGAHYLQWSDISLLRSEALHWLVLLLTLPAYVILTARVQRLHGALHKAGLRIRDIEEHARRDPLTGCYNRRYLVAALEEQKRLADIHGTPLCLAVLDLDHFKKINDEVGHLAGDEVLRTFAKVATNSIRSSDVFGRYGGEEFLIVLPETSLLAALNTAERIREQVEHHEWSGALSGMVTVSIGLTQYIAGESVLDLFSRTDTAMYLAKRGGRNQVVVEEPSDELWHSTEGSYTA